MNAFRVWCFLLPMIAGFGVPAMLASRARARGACLYMAGAIAVTLAWGLVAGATGAVIMHVSLYVLAFAVLAAGAHLLIGQVGSGLVVTTMTVWLFALARTFDGSVEFESIQPRIEWALAITPYSVMARSIFEIDPLQHQSMYSMWGYLVAYPKWGIVALWYVAIGFALGATGVAGRRYLRLSFPSRETT